jgi:hypothetical protein
MTHVPDAAAPQCDGIKVRPTPAESGETNNGDDSGRPAYLVIWISGVTLNCITLRWRAGGRDALPLLACLMPMRGWT